MFFSEVLLYKYDNTQRRQRSDEVIFFGMLFEILSFVVYDQPLKIWFFLRAILRQMYEV